MAMNLEKILSQVEKPGRYIGGEWNEIRKDPKSVKVKIALVFPDLYEVGMSYLGQKILYHILNNHPSFLAERVFAPWIDFEQKLRSQKIPLFSLENKIPLAEFDIIGFSLLYELDYSNILTILDLGHIPIFSRERNLKSPLVIGGGPAAFNPEPIADIFDLLLIGDGEEAFIEIVEKFMRLKEELSGKRAILKEMAKIKGVYIPSLYIPFQQPQSFLWAVRPKDKAPEKIEKRVLFPFQKAPFPEKIVVPSLKIIFDRVAVEVERGCPMKCRFCQASSIYFPPRLRSPSSVLHNVLNSLRWTGYEDASLTSLSVGDYPYINEIVKILMDRLEEKKISLSLSSLRPRCLSSEVSRNIIRVRKTGFTIVPEAGTERLRRVINKKIQDRDIWEAAKNAFSQGWKLLKLYFMVGLPTEKDQDLEGIVRVVKEIIRIGYKTLKSAPRINLSISSFIPKPHTPFQWLKMEDENILREKHRFLKMELKKYYFVRFKEHNVSSSILEAVFSRGDRGLNHALLEAWKKGARFDSWKDCFKFRTWDEAFKLENIDYHLYLQALNKNGILPWDHINTGIKKSYLLQEFDKAMREESTKPCSETSCKECQGCFYSSFLKRKYKEKVNISEDRHPYFGQKKENIFRYRAFYSKTQRARYLSHIDLNNIIHRSLRRADISVIHSKGFHPRMITSYLPALPLGMEGKKEVLEFKSNYLFSEKDFILRLNKFLPSGLRFLNLKRLEESVPSLQQAINILVYSVNLQDKEIKEALEKEIKLERNSLLKDEKDIEKYVHGFLRESKEKSMRSIHFNIKRGKLVFYIKYSPQRSIRPQDIVERIFRVKNSVFLMAREKVVLKKSL